jgi:hypothetical protein
MTGGRSAVRDALPGACRIGFWARRIKLPSSPGRPPRGAPGLQRPTAHGTESANPSNPMKFRRKIRRGGARKGIAFAI